MLVCLLLQLRQDVAGMAHRHPQDSQPLFRHRQLWIATPHDCFRLQLTRLLFQNVNTFWFLTLGIPDLGLPVVANKCLPWSACAFPPLRARPRSCQGGCSRLQLGVDGDKGPVLPQAEKQGMRWSPCSPPSPWKMSHVLATSLSHKYLDGLE